MKKIINLGVIIFGLGILLTIFYPIITSKGAGVKIGLILMGVGALIIIFMLILERIKDNKKFRKEFDKEDLRP